MKSIRNLSVLILTFAISGILSIDCRAEDRFEYEEPHMGTKFRIVLYAADKAKADVAAKAAFARVARLNDILSDYKPDSELSLLCKRNATSLAGPVRVSGEFFRVMTVARDVSAISDGAFDVTLGPVIKLWRAARKDRRLPDEEVLAGALKKVGHTKYKLDPKEQTIELLVPGMQLDVGGIAKGYAADECLGILRLLGIPRALVAASGDIAVGDPPPDKPHWRVEIGALPGSNAKRTLLLNNAAVSTSGDAEQFVEIAGVRYSHIVNPKTGLGLLGRRSVTVVAPQGISADSLTKMAMILPPEKALATIDRLFETSTLIVVNIDGKETTAKSKNFDALLETNPKKTE